MSDVPAWVARMDAATDATGYHCSGFEANATAREWREQQAEIERLNGECDNWKRLVNDAERAIGMASVAAVPSARSLVEWCDEARTAAEAAGVECE